VNGSAILGRVTNTIDPEPRPSLVEMLQELENAYSTIIDREKLAEELATRLLSIAGDLRWYTQRIGAGRSDTMPRANKWSLEQQIWRLTRRTKAAMASNKPIDYFIDQGKECVGAAAEIASLFESATAPE
jgi:hypothetical protein